MTYKNPFLLVVTRARLSKQKQVVEVSVTPPTAHAGTIAIQESYSYQIFNNTYLFLHLLTMVS